MALEDGTVEKVRELSGGERRVGGFLSDLIAGAWLHRETLGAAPAARIRTHGAGRNVGSRAAA